MHLDDTIVAISTPPGRGGIGVVRLSGPESVAITSHLLRFADGRKLEPGRAVLAEFVEPQSGERIDEVVATFFARPRSYTTDDVVEISCHGSPVVLQRAVELSMQSGARLASPGEFTMRAFLNGRLDLTQAEAVRDLIDAQTLYQAKVASQQIGGALSHRLQPVKQRLVELIALLEAGIDFAEDDVAVMPGEQIAQHITEICEPLDRLSASFAYGRVVQHGITMAIVGRPNVGKSSLFNQLVEQERAIVTSTPGTTRDLVTETVAIGGIPVRLVDTAGIRHALDEAEHIGIRKSMEALADADLVLVVLDSSEPLSNVDHEILADVEGRSAIVVQNKSDIALSAAGKLTNVNPQLSPDADVGEFVTSTSEKPAIRTSATTGEGIAELRSQILKRISGESSGQQEPGFLTNARQRDLVLKSLQALHAARTAVAAKTPHEMLLLDLYGALRALDEITGATTADDILNLIFGKFCIGK